MKLSLTLLVCLTVMPGCYSRLAKEAIHGFKGGDGHFILLTGQKDSLAYLPNRYGGVQVQPFQNTINATCPSEFLATLPLAIEEQLQFRDEKQKNQDGDDTPIPFFLGDANNTLLITGTVVHYDTGEFFDQLIGPMEEAICRVQISDAQTGVLLAEANCVGRAKSSIRKGPKELAAGTAKSIRKLLKPNKN